MRLLLSFAVIGGVVGVFGLLVWLAAGIARVEEHRSDEDRRMIAAVQRLDRENGQP